MFECVGCVERRRGERRRVNRVCGVGVCCCC